MAGPENVPPGWPPPGQYPPPPPGWQPAPPSSGPSYGPSYGGPPPTGAWGGPGWGAPPPPVHKPGIIALRPLGLGDLYDGAFRAIRHNVGATVGASVLVAALAMAIPVLVTAALGATGELVSAVPGDPTEPGSTAATTATALAFGSLGLGTLLQGLGTILVTAMVARVVGAAVVGRTMTLAEAWAETHGRRWRLLGLAALLAIGFSLLFAAYVAAWVLLGTFSGDLVVMLLFGLVSLPAFLALLVWLWVRLALLPATVLSLEKVSVLGAITRGRRLTLGHFWRVLGVALLTVVLTQVVGGVLSVPFVLVGELVLLAVDPGLETVVLVLSQAVATVVAAAFVTPFLTAVTALQYVDLRIRQEAFDVELLARTRPAGQ